MARLGVALPGVSAAMTTWMLHARGASPQEVAARALWAAVLGHRGLAEHWLWWAEQYRNAGWMA